MNKGPLVLGEKAITAEEFCEVVNNNRQVSIGDSAMELLKDSRKLVFELADEGVPIYGFTVGVGWNKDKRVFSKYFNEYNRNLIYAHCVSCGEPMNERDVRGALMARLCTFVVGMTGIQPELAEMYAEFLNRGIHPVIPWDGSVGQADIATLSHIGLAMIGEGDVFYKGERMAAMDALKQAGLEPIELGPKDGLAIVSSNAQGVGPGLVLINEIENLIRIANRVYALSLEGLDGNITPLNAKVNEIKGLPGQINCSKEIVEDLEGSYLFNKEITKKLQDPLSFRDVNAVHGAVLDAVNYCKDLLEKHINSTEDNPCIIHDERKIVSCSNFEATGVALGLEMLGLALGHISKMSVYRTIKLSNPDFTGLSRFLSPNEGVVQAYQTIQKCFTALDAQIRHLASPSTLDFYSVAGEIEDHANNTVQIVKRLQEIVDKIYYILGMEAMHAAQAVDLREGIDMGKGTKDLYESFREEVPFLSADRPLSFDIEKAYQVIKGYRR